MPLMCASLQTDMATLMELISADKRGEVDEKIAAAFVAQVRLDVLILQLSLRISSCCRRALLCAR